MPEQPHRSKIYTDTPKQMKSGVTLMSKLVYRNKYIFSLAVLALMALSSGAQLKWN